MCGRHVQIIYKSNRPICCQGYMLSHSIGSIVKSEARRTGCKIYCFELWSFHKKKKKNGIVSIIRPNRLCADFLANCEKHLSFVFRFWTFHPGPFEAVGLIRDPTFFPTWEKSYVFYWHSIRLPRTFDIIIIIFFLRFNSKNSSRMKSIIIITCLETLRSRSSQLGNVLNFNRLISDFNSCSEFFFFFFLILALSRKAFNNWFVNDYELDIAFFRQSFN